MLNSPRNRLLNVDFDILSQKIRNLFPNEQQGFYYVPPKSEGPSQKISKGKLPDFYRNKIDECRQSGLIPRKRKSTCSDIDDSDVAISFSRDGNINSKLFPIVYFYMKGYNFSSNTFLKTNLNCS